MTLYGKAFIENDNLYFRFTYLPFEKTAFAELGLELIWILLFILRLVSSDSRMDYFVTIVWGLLLLSRIPVMYDKFFRRSYANRIPLSAIQDFTTESDLHGIQTEVRLLLKNGRYRKIVFRNLEGQQETFLAAVLPSMGKVEIR